MTKRLQTTGILCVVAFFVVVCSSWAGGPGKAAAKARNIVVPKVEVQDVAFGDVIDGLQAESRRLDPDHEGVNIMLNVPPEKLPQLREQRITMSFRNLPLGDAIRYVCMAAGLHYKVEKNAIIIAHKDIPIERMETRFYPVPAGVFSSKPTRKAKPIEWRE